MSDGAGTTLEMSLHFRAPDAEESLMSTHTPQLAAPGWYADPQSPQSLRYFDGSSWTQHVAPVPAPAPHAGWTSAGVGAPTVTPGGLGAHPTDPVHWLVPTGRTWQSITAGYLGICSILLFPGPFAVWMGVWALRVSHRGGGHGRGRAVFGIITGALGTVGLLAWIASAVT